jgi:hypothetical protein
MTLPLRGQVREPNPCENGCGRPGYRAIVADPRVLCARCWAEILGLCACGENPQRVGSESCLPCEEAESRGAGR